MEISPKNLKFIIASMRLAYNQGLNMMEEARSILSELYGSNENHILSTMISYDAQAGSYVEFVKKNQDHNLVWGKQIANLIDPFLPDKGTILEVGVGEATTLNSVLSALQRPVEAYGFDISWSRIHVAKQYLNQYSKEATLFIGDLLHMPLADNSIDVVYSSHSLEPNGGKEEFALQECLRVAKHAVVLIEPIYELAHPEAQARMRHHGYVRNLKATAESLGATVVEYKLLEHIANSLNPSGVIILEKTHSKTTKFSLEESNEANSAFWVCPLTHTELSELDGAFFSEEMGIAYPILATRPMLSPQHHIIASKYISKV